MLRALSLLVAISLVACSTRASLSPGFTGPVEARDVAAIESRLDSLYGSFGHGHGEEPDWDQMRDHFVDGALFMGEVSPEASPRPQSVDAFIASWREAFRSRKEPQAAQDERIVARRLSRVGNLVRVDVEFIAHKATDPHERKPGRDSLTLIKVAGVWKVLAFVVHCESKL
jgi:SnoaL-like protein